VRSGQVHEKAMAGLAALAFDPSGQVLRYCDAFGGFSQHNLMGLENDVVRLNKLEILIGNSGSNIDDYVDSWSLGEIGAPKLPTQGKIDRRTLNRSPSQGRIEDESACTDFSFKLDV
jgi:hypothetical protein